MMPSRSSAEALLGLSPAIARIREIIVRVANANTTVLVQGESGTGKELVARTIHACSARAGGPFIVVNCADLARESLEDKLFGHLEGAFAGAVADDDGLLGAADGGTFFLDEIGEASSNVQAKLLRLLEDRRYARLGTTQEREVDVRVIAATKRDLKEDTAQRRFREDLFYHLHVVPIEMPPLRARGDDVLVLAAEFLERAASRHGRAVPRIGARARAALVNHDWPGNVRELANAMEAATLLRGEGEVEPEHLPALASTRRESELASHPPSSNDFGARMVTLLASYKTETSAEPPSLRDARDLLDRTYLAAVLERAGSNVALAAKLAGRNRTDFYDLLRRHGLTPSAGASRTRSMGGRGG